MKQRLKTISEFDKQQSKRENRCGEHSTLLKEGRRRKWERRESKAKA